MQLKAAERREVIEDLLDIQIFTVMNTLLKDKITNNKTEITEIKYQIDLLKNRIDSAKKHNESIRNMKEVEVDRLRQKLREQIRFIESEQASIEKLMEEISELANSITDKPEVQKSLQELQEIDRDLSSKYRTLTKEVSFYEHHDNCPTCKQGIEHDFKEATVSSHSAKSREI